MKTTSKKKTPAPPPGLRLSHSVECLDENVRALRASGVETMAEAAIICTAATTPGATLATIVKALRMPFSTASRVAWSLSERGLLRYAPHPTDRRKKCITANLERVA